MSSEFRLLRSGTNCVRVLGMPNRRVQECKKLERALKIAETDAERMKKEAPCLHHQHALYWLQSDILQEAELEFENIREELLEIQGRVVNSSCTRKLLAPVVLEQLNKVGNLLATTNGTLKLVQVVGALNIEHGSATARMFYELKTSLSCLSSPAVTLKTACQMKAVQCAVYNIAREPKVCSAHQVTGFVHLSLGVCLLEAEFGLQNFKVAAQIFHSAIIRVGPRHTTT